MDRVVPNLRSLAALAASALLLGAGVAGAWDAHHPGEHLPVGDAVYCAAAVHPDAPRHVEASPAVEGRFCPACLLRTQTEGLDLVPPADRIEAPSSSHSSILASPPLRLAPSIRDTSPRGPPPSRV